MSNVNTGLRTGLKLCTGKREAIRETLTTMYLHVALTPHLIGGARETLLARCVDKCVCSRVV
jgi:ABC-type thiamine transport system ATPase subunit